ncbi:hypothetical protein [Mycolicibacterium setense]
MSTDYWDRFRRLIDGLIAGTPTDAKTEGLKWERVSESTYELNLTRSTLRIRSRDGDGQYPFFFSILDENGQPTETIQDDGDESYVSWKLAELYSHASRSYSGADEKLMEVLRELGIDPEPDPWGTTAEPPF